MEEVDEGCLMSRMGVSQRMFLLASSGLRAVKRLCVCVVCVCFMQFWLEFGSVVSCTVRYGDDVFSLI